MFESAYVSCKSPSSPNLVESFLFDLSFCKMSNKNVVCPATIVEGICGSSMIPSFSWLGKSWFLIHGYPQNYPKGNPWSTSGQKHQSPNIVPSTLAAPKQVVQWNSQQGGTTIIQVFPFQLMSLCDVFVFIIFIHHFCVDKPFFQHFRGCVLTHIF